VLALLPNPTSNSNSNSNSHSAGNSNPGAQLPFVAPPLTSLVVPRALETRPFATRPNSPLVHAAPSQVCSVVLLSGMHSLLEQDKSPPPHLKAAAGKQSILLSPQNAEPAPGESGTRKRPRTESSAAGSAAPADSESKPLVVEPKPRTATSSPPRKRRKKRGIASESEDSSDAEMSDESDAGRKKQRKHIQDSDSDTGADNAPGVSVRQSKLRQRRATKPAPLSRLVGGWDATGILDRRGQGDGVEYWIKFDAGKKWHPIGDLDNVKDWVEQYDKEHPPESTSASMPGPSEPMAHAAAGKQAERNLLYGL
jgi:hypothetical protein